MQRPRGQSRFYILIVISPMKVQFALLLLHLSKCLFLIQALRCWWPWNSSSTVTTAILLLLIRITAARKRSSVILLTAAVSLVKSMLFITVKEIIPAIVHSCTRAHPPFAWEAISLVIVQLWPCPKFDEDGQIVSQSECLGQMSAGEQPIAARRGRN